MLFASMTVDNHFSCQHLAFTSTSLEQLSRLDFDFRDWTPSVWSWAWFTRMFNLPCLIKPDCRMSIRPKFRIVLQFDGRETTHHVSWLTAHYKMLAESIFVDSTPVHSSIGLYNDKAQIPGSLRPDLNWNRKLGVLCSIIKRTADNNMNSTPNAEQNVIIKLRAKVVDQVAGNLRASASPTLTIFIHNWVCFSLHRLFECSLGLPWSRISCFV